MTNQPIEAICANRISIIDLSLGCWAFVELMGHRERMGFAKEVEIAGGKMLRIDIPAGDGHVTEFYGNSAIYALRPATEEIIKDRLSEYGRDPRPVRPLDYREPEKLASPPADVDFGFDEADS